MIDSFAARKSAHACAVVHVVDPPRSRLEGELFSVQVVSSDYSPIHKVMMFVHAQMAFQRHVVLYIHWESLTDMPNLGAYQPAQSWIRNQRTGGLWNLWKERIFRGRVNAVIAANLLIGAARHKKLLIATDNPAFVYAIMHELAIDLGENPQEIIGYLMNGKRVRQVPEAKRVETYARDMQTFPPQTPCTL